MTQINTDEKRQGKEFGRGLTLMNADEEKNGEWIIGNRELGMGKDLTQIEGKNEELGIKNSSADYKD